MSKVPPSGAGRSPASPPKSKQSEHQQAVIGQLNEHYKQLTALLETAEERLKAFRIAKDVSVLMRTEEEYMDGDETRPTGESYAYFLGFARCANGWRICYGSSYSRDPSGEIEWKPVVECRLDTRLEVIDHLDDLREKVLVAAEKTVPQLDAAVAKLRDTLKDW